MSGGKIKSIISGNLREKENAGSLESDDDLGLTSKQVEIRLEKYGPNKLPEKPTPSDFKIFISQLKNPLVYILLVAGIVTSLLKEVADTSIIGFAVFINTILGFLQERKANNSLEELKKLVHPEVRVIRDGRMVTVGVETLVPGDVVVLKQGDKIPADGKLIKANRFFVTEAILTGESEAIHKKEGAEVFMGTIVTAGNARMKVYVTGEETEMGKIALNISQKEELTPLGKQLVKFSKSLTFLVLGLIFTAFLVGLTTGKDVVEIFTTAVALAVSAIPEGLLVGLTVVLAIGMQRILKRKGLVRNLVSAETLGGVTTICVDKTGTLTQGKMQVVDIVGSKEDIALHCVVANDLDTSVVVSAFEWAKEIKAKNKEDLMNQHGQFDSIPFSSEHKFFASLNRWDENSNMVFVTGAPEVLLENTNLDFSEKIKIKERIKKLSGEGKRLLGFGRKKESVSIKELHKSNVLNGLEWVGFLAFDDPIREDVKGALEKTRDAGINLMVITGDYADTAISVLSQLGINIKKEDVVLGKDLDSFSSKELERRIFGENKDTDEDGLRSIKLFARTKPDQKLKIVDTLKLHNEVVAMMGDGVNDAPALSRADIGIVVGEASDVAKESADLVLLDSGFETIVAAVEEGRAIFDNLRKIILYLMCDAFEGILTVLSAIILRLPLPVTTAQILWINLLSDGFPHLALTVDPKVPGIMERGPRSPRENLISPWMRKLIALVSIIGWIFAFGAYYFILRFTEDVVLARSVAFVTLGINSLVYVFSVRTLTDPFWREGFFENKWLLVAVGVGLIFQVLPFSTSKFRSFFELKSLGIYWIISIMAAIFMFFSIEIFKWLLRGKLRKDARF